MDPAVGALVVKGVQAAADFGLGAANTAINKELSEKNLQFQKDVFNYQKQLQRELFQREDSSIQRRKADIIAAGGNPAMAWETGQGAQAGSAVPVTAPKQDNWQMSNLLSSSLGQISDGLKQFQEANLNDAQIKNIKASTAKSNAETITEAIRQKQLELQNAKTEEEKNKIKLEIEALDYDLNYSIDHNIRTHDNNSSIYTSGKDLMAEISQIIPDDLEGMDGNMLLELAKDVGLTLIPGLATLKLGSIGIKGLKAALKVFKKNKGVNNTQNFYEIFRQLVGRAPNKKEVDEFNTGRSTITDIMNNEYSKKGGKSYYYRKYNKR